MNITFLALAIIASTVVIGIPVFAIFTRKTITDWSLMRPILLVLWLVSALFVIPLWVEVVRSDAISHDLREQGYKVLYISGINREVKVLVDGKQLECSVAKVRGTWGITDKSECAVEEIADEELLGPEELR